MDEELVAYVCKCGDLRSTHHTPSACFRCGARFDTGASIALVNLVFGVVAKDGVLRVAPSYRVAFAGAWSADERAEIGGLFSQEEPAASSQIAHRVAITSDSSSE